MNSGNSDGILRVLIWSRNYERTSEKLLLGAKLSKFLDEVLRTPWAGVI